MTKAQSQAQSPAEQKTRSRSNSGSGAALQFTLDCVPGDVLFIRGTGGGITEIGTTGGFLGHFLVVVASPQALEGSELRQVLAINGQLDATRLYKVETVESTRSHRGLHKSHMVLYMEPVHNALMVVAEFISRRREIEVVEVEQEPVQLWQCPAELRSEITEEAVREVLYQMKAEEQNWSLATAARAVLLQASVQGRKANDALLSELCSCWQEAPICTSIVVVFWQRLLGQLSAKLRAGHCELILRYLPLKADRGLPNDLLRTMNECGWVLRQRVFCSL